MTPDDELRSLPALEPPRDLAAQVRRAAVADLRASTEPAWRRLTARAWTRVALPAAITVTVLGYLHWAVLAAMALTR